MDLQYRHSSLGLSKHPACTSRTDQRQHRTDAVAAIPAPRFVPWGWAKPLAPAWYCTPVLTHDRNVIFQYRDNSKKHRIRFDRPFVAMEIAMSLTIH